MSFVPSRAVRDVWIAQFNILTIRSPEIVQNLLSRNL